MNPDQEHYALRAMQARYVTCFVACSCLLTLSVAAPGQSTDTPETATELQEVFVRGRRPTVPDGAVGATVTARDADEALAKDIGELLQSSVPGIVGQRLGGVNVDPVLRGTRAERVNVTIDGAQIHGACPSRMDPQTSLLDVADVEAIDVVKGPYSVTRGPAGVGGNINIHTKDPHLFPSFTARGSVMAGYTSNYDGWTARGSAWAGGEHAVCRVTGGFRDFGNYAAANGERVPSSFQNRNAGGTLLWQTTQADRLRLDANVDSARDVRFASATMDTAKADAYVGAASYTRQRPLNGIENVTVTGYYNYIDHHMDNEDKPTARMMHMETPLNAKTFGGRLQVNLDPVGLVKFTVGGDAYRVEHDGTRQMVQRMGPIAGVVTTSTVWPDTHIVDGGLFAEVTYPLASHWRGVIGTRMDVVDAGAHPDQAARTAFVKVYGFDADATGAFETNVSANGRVIHSPVDTVDLFFGLGRAVRTASPTERFYVFGPGSGGYLIGNPTLEPEQSFEADIGAAAQWGGFSLNGSFFYNRIDQYIAPVLLARADVNMDGPVDIVRGFHNLQAATLTGVDWGGTCTLSDELSVLGSVAYVFGQNESTHQPLAEIPPLEGSLGLRYQRSWTGGSFGWIMPRLRLVDRQDRVAPDFGENTSPGFATVDLFSGLRLLDRYELSLNIANVLDKNYHEHLTRENPFTGAEVPEPGRMVNLALRMTL